ncbi:nucleotidyltransferase family protein [Neobacillus sp. BF23-41]|uniref:nucleotidyltransferase family protein n=1 Tax=Neobacillus sp. BF23-41 TaxID=3240280 RepID=UPI0034E40233
MELVKFLYDDKNPLPQDESFYHQALQDIEYDGIQSQIYFLLKQQARIDQTPAFFQYRLKEEYDKGLYQNLFIKNQTDQVLRVFEDQGIDVIPLKGVYFAENFFGQIGARATSDIDLLVKDHDLESSIRSIKSLGFSVEEEKIPGHFHCSFSKALPYTGTPLVVELHWNFVRENTSKFNINDIWAQSLPVGRSMHVKELSPSHTFYMICLHGWRHNLDSMKYFIDIIQVIYKYREELNYEQIFRLAASHQTLKRMIRTLSIVYQQFPHLNDIKKVPFKIKKTQWEYRPPKSVKQYIDFIDYQFFSFDTVKHSLIELVNWVWPSQYEVSSQIENDSNGINMYYSLYKKRVASMFKSLFHH